MTPDEQFNLWLFPPVLSRRRKIVINCIMLAITILVAHVFNGPVP